MEGVRIQFVLLSFCQEQFFEITSEYNNIKEDHSKIHHIQEDKENIWEVTSLKAGITFLSHSPSFLFFF